MAAWRARVACHPDFEHALVRVLLMCPAVSFHLSPASCSPVS